MSVSLASETGEPYMKRSGWPVSSQLARETGEPYMKRSGWPVSSQLAQLFQQL